MARVFVSHANEDFVLAREVHQWLIEAGHEVFLARDLRDGIAVGQEWEQRLHDELRRADAVVCVLTSAYLASQWCTAEVAIVRSRGGKLLPLQAEPGVVHPLLKAVQHTDLTQDPEAVRPFLIGALRLVAVIWPEGRSPFPGLRPFEIDQHRVFFGRTEETKELAELLRSPAEHAKGAALLVVGPSGCGKSSLVRAGLVPVMAGEPGWWTLPPIVPGADPVAALARELAAATRQLGLDLTVAQVRQQLDNGRLGELADELLLASPSDPWRRLLVVVDQFEELLTQTTPTERARFAELLRPALAGRVQLVATLRPEFLDQLLADPDLVTLPTQVYPLRPLRREALRAVIEKPAGLAGINLDDGLVDRLVDDTAGGEALPLLAFTLAQLADGITRGGRLSRTRYDQLGGVQGALSRQADAALTDARTTGGRSGEQVIGGLLRLVTVDEQGHPTRWRVNPAELPDHVVAELNAFVARRLLITDTDNGVGIIGVAHEAFLSAWSPLAGAIATNVMALRTCRAVENATTEWHDNGRPSTRLWGGDHLGSAMTDIGGGTTQVDAVAKYRPRHWSPRRHRMLVTGHVGLTPKARDFLHASIRRDSLRRRRGVSVLSVLLIIALIGAGVALVQQHDAKKQLRVATARQLVAEADRLLESDLRTALKLGLAAQGIHPDGETHSGLVNMLTNTRYSGTLTGHADAVLDAVFAPDGRTLATGSRDHTVILWGVADPTRPQRLSQLLTGHTSELRLAFTPDGHTLATNGEDNTVILWDLTDLARPQRLGRALTGHTDPVSEVAFAPDGRILATADTRGAVILWDVSDPASPRQLGQPLYAFTSIVNSVAFAPGGRTLATASRGGSVALWDIGDPAQPHELSRPLSESPDPVSSVVFTPDGRTLATADARETGGKVILWNVTDPARPQQLGQPLAAHTGAVYDVAFAPDGHTLATASERDAVILWDITDPARPQQLGQPLAAHTGAVYDVAFAPDGHTLATAGDDRTVILWEVTDPARRRLGQSLIAHTSAVYDVAFAPDGRTLATASERDAVILWDVTDRARPQRLGQLSTGQTEPAHNVAFAPDGRTLATASEGDAVILWDVTDRARPQRLGQPLTGHADFVRGVAFAPDGRTLAVGSADHTVILWDVTDRARPQRLGQPLNAYHSHFGLSFMLEFAREGHTLATNDEDDTVILWDVTDPARPQPLGQPRLDHPNPLLRTMTLASDGHTLAVAGADNINVDKGGIKTTVILWDLTDPARPHQRGQPLTVYTELAVVMAFAPDGHTLVTAGESGRVIFWDLTDPARPQQRGQALNTHTASVTSVAFAPDGRTLATASRDTTVILWDLTKLKDLQDHAIERACSIARGGLNRDDWDRYIPELPYQDTCPG